MTTRKIIHIDMDAFFASVEMRDNPSLKAFPIAVGGDPKGRGVIATANYKARKFGVRSAMPSWKALQLCPDLRILPSNFEKYKQESRAINEIFQMFTDIIEPLSLDEAFLDVTSTQAFGGSATLIAEQIRGQIWDKLQLTASAGVAPNKFLAKVASDWNKPNGFFVITPEEVSDFVKHLPVEKIPGIGSVATQKLHSLDIFTCEELQQMDLSLLHDHFGARAWGLHKRSFGIDTSPVRIERTRKSISVECTFLKDLLTLEECLEQVPPMYEKLMQRYSKHLGFYRIKKPFIKLKFSDFTTTTVETVLYPLSTISSYHELIKMGWERKKQAVRLIGLGMSLNDSEEIQLTLF
jgi:DNA polymerase-4